MTLAVRGVEYGIKDNNWMIRGLTWNDLDRASITTWFLTCKKCEFSSLLCNLACTSYKVCSSCVNLDSVDSCIMCKGSAGVPGWEIDGFEAEYESLCTRACREARRLISLRPTRSPRLKFPLPCLNSHNADSGEPV